MTANSTVKTAVKAVSTRSSSTPVAVSPPSLSVRDEIICASAALTAKFCGARREGR